MWTKPNAVLDEEELELLNDAPEECLRHVVQRGALSLDQITGGLAPRVAATVRSIATGERLTVLEGEPEWEIGVTDYSRGGPKDDDLVGPQLTAQQRKLWAEMMRPLFSPYPQLAGLLDEQILTPVEAREAAHAIDVVLGRYLTGTRYAAP